MAIEWFAMCTYRHPQWFSDNFQTEEEAKKAAKKHDDEKHGGEESASVMNTG